MKDALRKLAILLRDCWYVQLLAVVAFAWLGYWISKREDPAAWVQAVGSLVGIAIAIAVPAWQRKGETQDAQRADRKIFRAIALKIREDIRTLKIELHTRVTEMQDEIDGVPHQWTYHPHNQVNIGGSLRKVFMDITLIARCPECMQHLAANVNEYDYITRNGMQTYSRGRAMRVNSPYDEIIGFLEDALAYCIASEDEVENHLRSN